MDNKDLDIRFLREIYMHRKEANSNYIHAFSTTSTCVVRTPSEGMFSHGRQRKVSLSIRPFIP